MEKSIVLHRGLEITIMHRPFTNQFHWNFDYIDSYGYEIRRSFTQPTRDEALEEARYEIDLIAPKTATALN